MLVVVVISQHLLNVFVQLANKRGLKKEICTSVFCMTLIGIIFFSKNILRATSEIREGKHLGLCLNYVTICQFFAKYSNVLLNYNKNLHYSFSRRSVNVGSAKQLVIRQLHNELRDIPCWIPGKIEKCYSFMPTG
jgi:hypothetical protein